jgi:hypothetical protein
MWEIEWRDANNGPISLDAPGLLKGAGQIVSVTVLAQEKSLSTLYSTGKAT